MDRRNAYRGQNNIIKVAIEQNNFRVKILLKTSRWEACNKKVCVIT